MARARFENLEPDRQEAILSAAGSEFAAHGYAGASLNRIIEAADISKGSLYYYFDDKADLFASVVEVTLDRLKETAAGFDLDELSRSDFWDRARQVALSSVEMLKTDEWWVRLAMAFPRLRKEPEAVEGVQPMLDWGREYTRAFLRRGRELQVVRRDLPLELLVEVTMAADEAGDRWMVENLESFEGDEFIKLVKARIDMTRDMLDAENEGWES